MLRLLKSTTPQKPKHSTSFFHLVIFGRSGCGKTKLLLRLLHTEFHQIFNAIFLICPTFIKNQTYDSFTTDDKFYVVSNSIEHLDYSIDLVRREATKYFRSLVIFDDVIGSTTLQSRVSNYVNLLTGGRHDGISTITLTQQLNSVSKPARDQMTRIISFYNPNAEDRRVLFDNFLIDTPRKEIQDIVTHLRTKDFGYIDINILKGTYTLA